MQNCIFVNGGPRISGILGTVVQVAVNIQCHTVFETCVQIRFEKDLNRIIRKKAWPKFICAACRAAPDLKSGEGSCVNTAS